MIETDYLVVGAGAAGLAFVDSLIEHAPEATVVMIDRRHAPGGHWNDAYPFVRLHQPSAFYGVDSMPLGDNAIDRVGANAGCYEVASAPEICGYFARVMQQRLLPSGRVRFFPLSDYVGDFVGDHRFVSKLTGETTEVRVRRKVVDGTYLETSVPATSTPGYEIADGVRWATVADLARVREPQAGYVIIGAGKTGMDACLWLLDRGVPPAMIRWIKPRESWALDRRNFQPLQGLATTLGIIAKQLECAAQAESIDDLFRRLEDAGVLVRIDPEVTPTMYHCATVNPQELEQLRGIDDVVRLGRVRRIGPDTIELEQGSVPTTPGHLHVDCTAKGLAVPPPRPIFESGRITLQQVRVCAPTFNAALVGYIEATREDLDEQNRLCPPNPYPDEPTDWMPGMRISLAAARAWSAVPDVQAWVDGTRLNFLGGMLGRAGEPEIQHALGQYLTHVEQAVANLEAFEAQLA